MRAFSSRLWESCGGDEGDLKEIRVLNRILKWTSQGITYEADPRLVEQLVQDFPPHRGSSQNSRLEVHL